jgi:DNA-binding Lrp family transcriptional regulator
MWTQDKAYAELMSELWGSPERWNARKTYTDVAAKLGIDEETVRNRLKRLRQSGFLLGWRLVPNPTLFGRESAMVLVEFEDREAKEKAIPKLKQMDGVVVIASVYGDSVLVTVYDDSEHKATNLMASVKGVAHAQPVGGIRFGSTDFRMTPTDWQIVGLMLRNAEEDMSTVARKVKISERTAKRRLNGMMDSSAVSVMPVVDQRRSGGVSYTMMVEAEEGKVSEVGSLVASNIAKPVFRATYSKNGLIFGFFAANVPEGSEILRSIKKLEGVKSARGHVVDEVVYAFDWLEREAAKRSAYAEMR